METDASQKHPIGNGRKICTQPAKAIRAKQFSSWCCQHMRIGLVIWEMNSLILDRRKISKTRRSTHDGKLKEGGRKTGRGGMNTCRGQNGATQSTRASTGVGVSTICRPARAVHHVNIFTTTGNIIAVSVSKLCVYATCVYIYIYPPTPSPKGGGAREGRWQESALSLPEMLSLQECCGCSDADNQCSGSSS